MTRHRREVPGPSSGVAPGQRVQALPRITLTPRRATACACCHSDGYFDLLGA